MAKEEKKVEAKKEEEKDKEKTAPAEGEAESGEGLEESAEGGKKKLSKKMLIIIGAVGVLLCLGTGAGLYFAGVFGGGDSKKEESESSSSSEKGHGAFFSLGDILVNLSGEGKHPNFLKIKVSLELADPKDVPLIEAIKPRIIDNFQVYLRELRIEDLRGSAGLYRLREELLLRVTEAAQPIRVRDVLFQEMLVQ